jgi:hypothetical protein
MGEKPGMRIGRGVLPCCLWLLLLTGGFGVWHGAVAADEERSLEVGVVVCPVAAERPPLAACEERVARDFAVSVVDAAAAPVVDEVAPGADGRAAVALEAEAAGELRVVVNTAVEVGSREVACEADGRALDARLGGGAAAIPVFDVAVPVGVDVSCVVYLYGFRNDAAALDIIPAVATPVAVATPIQATPIAE